MPTIKPFRDIDEHDVINLFKVTGAIPFVKGTFVKIVSGWNTEQDLSQLGDVGAHYNNTVSQRYGVNAAVTNCDGSGDAAIGITLYDVREVDENGNKLILNHQSKQEALQCVLSGQAVPIATKGLFLYSGVNGGRTPVVGVTAGAAAYLGTDGGVNVSGSAGNANNVTRIGTFYGVPDANGFVLLKVNL